MITSLGAMNSKNNIDLGFEAHQRGDYQLALHFYEQALFFSPSDAEVLSLKGSVLSSLSRGDEAEVLLKKAIELEPQASGFWLNLADHYVRSNKLVEACELIVENVSHDSKDKQVWQFLYQTGLKAHKLNFAIVGLKRLIGIGFNFSILITLSQLLVRETQFNEAIAVLKTYQSQSTEQNSYWHALCWLLNSQRQWMELKNQTLNWLNYFGESRDAVRYLANANFELGLFHNAIALYETKLLLEETSQQPLMQSDSSADDQINYINLCIATLELEKAEIAISKAFELKSAVIVNAEIQLAIFKGDLTLAQQKCLDCISQFPDYFPVYSQLVRIAPTQISPAQIESIISYVCEEHSDSDSLAFVLGHYFHNKNESETAWQWYSEANRLRKVRNFERGANYSQHEAQDLAQRVIALEQSLANVEACNETGSIDGENFIPIFVLGMPRSGSTLLEGLLAQHSDICKTGERIEFPNLVYHLVSENWEPAQLLTKLQEFKQLYVRNATTKETKHTYYIDKNPSNYLTIGLIKSVFPQAVIIDIKRTAIETIWSIFRHEFSHMWSYATSIDNIAHQYAIYERLMAYWHERYDGIVTVHYEQLVENPIEVVSAIWNQLELDSVAPDPDQSNAKTAQRQITPIENQSFTTLSAVQVRGEIKNLNGQAAMYFSQLSLSLKNYPQYLSNND